METIPPWDQLQYFDFPRITQPTLGAVSLQVLTADPRRVGIIFSNGQGAIQAYVNPGPQPTPIYGMVLAAGTNIYIPNFYWGPLTQVEWYASAPGGPVPLNIIELLLRDWPTNIRQVESENARNNAVPKSPIRSYVNPAGDLFTIG